MVENKPVQTVKSALRGQEGEEWGVEEGCSCLEVWKAIR